MADDLNTLANRQVPLVGGASTNYATHGMDALKLLIRLKEKCGVSGSNPVTVTGLSGEIGRLFNYINDAWLEIQSLHDDWEFMRQPVSFVTQATKSTYSAAEQTINSFAGHKLNSFSFYPVGNEGQEQELFFLPWDDFRRRFQFGSGRTESGPPKFYSVTPQGDMVLGPIPDGSYRISGECYAQPSPFVNATDRPAMPPQFHMAIVFKAMQYYGTYEAAPEIIGEGTLEYNRLIARLAASQLPKLTFGEPLI